MSRLLAFASPMRWARLARLDGAQRSLLIEAAVGLASASARSRLMPFRRAIQSASGPLATPSSCDIEAIARAIRRASAIVPFRVVCLQQGLACQAMLRRRGVDARLHYGAALEEGLQAQRAGHGW